MVSAGSYLLSALALAALALSLGFSAFRLRGALMPAWSGAPARLVESILASRPPDLDRRAPRNLQPALRVDLGRFESAAGRGDRLACPTLGGPPSCDRTRGPGVVWSCC